MAKSKQNIPTINPPNGGMKAWLEQNDSVGNVPPTDDKATNDNATINLVDESKSAVTTEKQAITNSDSKEETSEKGESQPNDTDVVIKGEGVTSNQEAASDKTAVSVPRKLKTKAIEGEKAGVYPETFFKKPVKASGNNLAGDGKPVRVSEESHLLISVLVSEARRLGYKLNVGDLIDNLLAHHRVVYKDDVDKLIVSWKSRKSFE